MGNSAGRAVSAARRYPPAPSGGQAATAQQTAARTHAHTEPSPSSPPAAAANAATANAAASSVSAGSGAAAAGSAHADSPVQQSQQQHAASTTAAAGEGLAGARAPTHEGEKPPTAAEQERLGERIGAALKNIQIVAQPLSGVEHRTGPAKSFPQLSRAPHADAVIDEVPGRLTTPQVVKLLELYNSGTNPDALAVRFQLQHADVEALVKHFVSPWKPVAPKPPQQQQ